MKVGILKDAIRSLLPVLICLILFLVPQWVKSGLMFPTRTDKFFLFSILSAITMFALILTWFIKPVKKIRITILDLVLFLNFLYHLLRTDNFTGIAFYEYILLALFYLFVRNTPAEQLKFVFLFLIAGGSASIRHITDSLN